jgi:hypothetical protein
MNPRPLLALAALAAATSPDFGAEDFDQFKQRLRDTVARDPMNAMLATALGAAWLFHRVEVGHNPKVKSFYDALVFITTSFSVGYSDIFPQTAAGKAIASAIQVYGPAMSSRIFEPPANEDTEMTDSRAIVDRLDRILAALEKNAAQDTQATGEK